MQPVRYTVLIFDRANLETATSSSAGAPASGITLPEGKIGLKPAELGAVDLKPPAVEFGKVANNCKPEPAAVGLFVEPLASLDRGRDFISPKARSVVSHVEAELVGPLVANSGQGASLWMSACIILAQLLMIPMAAFAGKYAEIWGRKRVFLIGLVALPIRGVLYGLPQHAVQLSWRSDREALFRRR